MNIEKFLYELHLSHEQDTFTEYVTKHWSEAVNMIEKKQIKMDEINSIIHEAADNHKEFDDTAKNILGILKK
ncbi:hypothetical protein [Enterococcus sp. DIV1297f]|uniref:hypothetical protein n=1 Tax=Enterococcus sp. DIV1297f TaxID=2774691 RepID=UPI003D2966FE